MSNKPKKEKRIVPYTHTKKEKKYISLCKVAYSEKGTTKKMKQIKAAAKGEEGPKSNKFFRIPFHVPGF